jgi:hypothetical protein
VKRTLFIFAVLLPGPAALGATDSPQASFFLNQQAI